MDVNWFSEETGLRQGVAYGFGSMMDSTVNPGASKGTQTYHLTPIIMPQVDKVRDILLC